MLHFWLVVLACVATLIIQSHEVKKDWRFLKCDHNTRMGYTTFKTKNKKKLSHLKRSTSIKMK